jgi:hypothetical protein
LTIELCYRFKCDFCGAIVQDSHSQTDIQPWSAVMQPCLPDGWLSIRSALTCPRHEVVVRDVATGKEE